MKKAEALASSHVRHCAQLKQMYQTLQQQRALNVAAADERCKAEAARLKACEEELAVLKDWHLEPLSPKQTDLKPVFRFLLGPLLSPFMLFFTLWFHFAFLANSWWPQKSASNFVPG